ncbi:MAG: CDP-glycerol glycerophosphotransferase family protein [Fidelibacterota bacterium]
MRFILLVTKPYSFSILEPLYHYLADTDTDDVYYFLSKNIATAPHDRKVMRSNAEVTEYQPDAILVPGNVVPHFWPGMKVQLFHGLGEEKRGHYRITNFFDVYCTPGPYMTQKFQQLARRHNHFLVRETGWAKLDRIDEGKTVVQAKADLGFDPERPLILFAPTFSPRYSSAQPLWPAIKNILDKPFQWVFKFHDLMDRDFVRKVENTHHPNLILWHEPDILPLMAAADIMISDTSSVVYEYLLLDRPIITYQARVRKDKGLDIDTPDDLFGAIIRSLEDPDEFHHRRQFYREDLHPYTDHQSSRRVIETVKSIYRNNELQGLRPKRPNWIQKRQVRQIFSR